ncbi:MAG: ABC transporter ATP-binding protein [Thermodesulfobacteriota bacterium]
MNRTDDTSPNILEVRDLKVHFPVHQSLLGNLFHPRKEYIHAVDGVSFNVRRNETIAVVGESGSGKTTLGRTLTLMVRPTGGKIFLEGQDVTELPAKAAQSFVRKKIQMIFQDPFSSLNPRKTVQQAIEVPLKLQRHTPHKERRVVELLELTGLPDSARFKYPHELSGGQRQRVVIARALAAEPQFLVADEPVSKLDLSIKAQIINLFLEIQKRMGLTIMFIAHDLRMAKHISSTVAVMYHGRIMEVAESQALFKNPLHPYTRALIKAIPTLDPERRKTKERENIKVQDISLVNPPKGCRYYKSCPSASEKCEHSPIDLKKAGENHWVACDL